MPTKYKWLERYSGTSVMDVKMNDASIYELFQSTAPLGISPDDTIVIKHDEKDMFKPAYKEINEIITAERAKL